MLERARARAAEALAFNPREVVALVVMGLLVVVGASLAYVRARPASAAAPAPAASATQTLTPPEASATLYVHVAGAVRRPGVYPFTEGARVIDAIEAAGGLRNGADATAVNMARPLVDGEQIVVPSRRAPAADGATGSSSDLINLNTASATELEALPGVGPVLAQRIVDYREQHGPFTDPKDLLKVSGIGPKTFESIEPLVTV